MSTIQERYHQLHPTSARKFEEARRLFPGGVTHDTRRVTPFPVFMTHGAGPLKWDVDGNEYVDYVVGHGALLLGHSHPKVTAAVAHQAGRGTHLGGSTELETAWASGVQRMVPSAEKVRFTSSGTEATLMALRLARAYTGRNKVIKFEDHFHGWHDYLIKGVQPNTSGVPDAVVDTVYVAEPNNIASVERILAQDPDVAAVILEPTGAHMGLYPVFPRFLRELREVTSRQGVVLIFDEVVTGFRTSNGGAQALYGVKPDLTTMAKVLGGGLPGGAVAGKAEILDMIGHRDDPEWNARHRVNHPGTFNANPLSAAAGSTALGIVEQEPVNARAEAAARRLRQGLNEVMRSLEVPGLAYGVTTCVFIAPGVPGEVDADGVCTIPHDKLRSVPPAVFAASKRALLNAGVDCMGGRTFLLSCTHGEQEVDRTVAGFEQALAAMQQEGLV
ncbi:MAG: aspartate aminotransferase family protein [Chloroflexi bacterium]|nr:aspartate aminotransferase family protein [Chloroflexota bacterium]